MKLTVDQIREAQGILGYTDADLVEIYNSPGIEVARERMDAFQKRIHAAWRKAALRLHPDQGGDAELFKRVGAVAHDIEELRVVERPRPPPVQVVWFTGSSFTDSTSSSGSTAWFTWNGLA